MSTLELELPRKAKEVLMAERTADGKPVRYRCLYGGRDGAKSHSIARVLLARGMARIERVLCVREVQLSISDSVHKLLSDLIKSLSLEWFYRVQKVAITGANGTEFAFRGLSAETRDSLKSAEGTTICWVEEAQTITKRSWEILEPTIRAPGSEIIVSFNPGLDTDETYVRFVEKPPSDAVVGKINWDDNPWRSTVLDEARSRMRKEAPEDFEHVYGGKPRTSVEGAIYGNEISACFTDKRIRPVPYDPMLKVHTVWDLGFNDRMSIIFCQRLLNQVLIIDFLEDEQQKYDYYVEEIKGKRYNLGRAFLPHDGDHDSPLPIGTPVKVLRRLGLNVAPALPREHVELGIRRVRMTFPRMFFDEVRCKPLIEHLRRYKRHVPTTTGEPAAPMHDEHSHASDALRYLCMALSQMSNDSLDQPLPKINTGVV